MGENLISSTVTVLTAIIGLAIVAVLVSKNANTSGVIGAGGSAFSQALAAAEAPVTGASSMGASFAGNTGFAGFNNED
jgi:hypothetical protein